MNGFRMGTVIGPQIRQIVSERTTHASATVRRARACIEAQTRRQSKQGVVKVTPATLEHQQEAADATRQLGRWAAIGARVARPARQVTA
jgi:hypothetical protein